MTEEKLINYGPLAALIGKWYGDRGVDVAPEPAPDNVENIPYFETITFEEAGDLTNAKQQVLALVRYHQVVSRKATNKVFHDQMGYWMWDSATNIVMHSLVIPRAVAVVSTGTATAGNGKVTLSVKASNADGAHNIAESAYMATKAKTTAFSLEMTVSENQLEYSQTTVLNIYDKNSFDHTDHNKLSRV